MSQILKFTDLAIKALPKGKYFDPSTPGFGIRVGAHRRTWIVVRGKQRQLIRLGHYPTMPLSEARTKGKQLLAATLLNHERVTFKEAYDLHAHFARYRRFYHRSDEYDLSVAKQAYADFFECIPTLPPTSSIDLNFPAKSRYTGTWIIAPPGKGKTNLLWQLIDRDLDGTKTVVLMDSKGVLIKPFRHHPDAIIIDYNNAALNPLLLGASSEFLQYIFSSLLEVEMTGLQRTLFSAVLEVLNHHPQATIENFRDILNNGIGNYLEAVKDCSTDTQEFFTLGKPTEFNNSTYKDTKDQLKWRLRLLLQNDYMRRIFTSKHLSHDFLGLLDSKKIIIIDNSKRHLWKEGAEFFGRFFVALIWMGAVSRSDKPRHQKVPVCFYIDECHTVISRDEMFRTIIQECRDQNIAVTCAHQYLIDLTDVVKPALYNFGIRIANADDDASQLASRLNTEPEKLKLPDHSFAVFVRDQTPTAVTIQVPFFDLDSIPQGGPYVPPEPPRMRQEERRQQEAPAAPRQARPDQVEDF